MKILIIKYDNGFAVTATDEVVNVAGQMVERKRRWVLEIEPQVDVERKNEALYSKLKEIFA